MANQRDLTGTRGSWRDRASKFDSGRLVAMTARRLVLVVILAAVGIGMRVFAAKGGLDNLSIGTDLILICAILVLMFAALKFVNKKNRSGGLPPNE